MRANAWVGIGWMVAAVTLAHPAYAEEPQGVTLDIERVVSMSPEEIRAWAADVVAELDQNVRALDRLDGEARKKTRSDEGLPCVTTARTAAEALARASKDALAKLEGYLQSGDTTKAQFAMRQLAVAGSSGRLGRASATQCALGIGIQEGRTRTTLEGGDGENANDLVGLPNDILDYGFDPPSSSPF